MTYKGKLIDYLEGNINDTEFIAQWLLENADSDCTDTTELAFLKENAALRSLVRSLLLEIRFPTVATLLEIRKLKEDINKLENQ
jgi:hypothetical protein